MSNLVHVPVPPMVTTLTMSHGRVPVPPVAVAIVAAIGVRVARSLILAIGVWVKECAIAGLRDHVRRTDRDFAQYRLNNGNLSRLDAIAFTKIPPCCGTPASSEAGSIQRQPTWRHGSALPSSREGHHSTVR